jgi:hypothetical protein
MKSALEKWLSPESDATTENAFPTPAAAAPKTNNFSLDTSNVKKSKNDQFDTLFDDGEKDDLPF